MQAKQQWIDITQDILKLPKSLKLLQIVHNDKFNLQDGMHAHQINDNKIDPKFDISQNDTIQSLIKNKQVKLPNQLNINQILAIYVQVIKKQALILQGYPYQGTIYTLTYLYDQSVYKTNQFIQVLINSINLFGSYVYGLHKESCSIKEDDLSFSSFSFSQLLKTNDQMIKHLNSIEIKLTSKAKQDKQKGQSYNRLINLIKLRKSIHNVTKSMGKYFQSKNQTKILKDIQSLKSVIQSVQKICSGENYLYNQSQQILKQTGVFNQRISKTLRANFGNRDIPSITFKQSLQIFNNALLQFQLFFPIPNRVSLLKDKIEKLHDLPINLWSKSYIKNNMFHKQQHIFSTLKTQQLIINDIHDYITVKDSWKNDQKFTNLVKLSCPVISQILFRYLGRNTRSFSQISKVYEDFNIVIHLANQFDTSIFPVGKKQLHVSSWYYNFGVSVLIKQLFTGIQTQIYQNYEYPYVFYLLQNYLGVYDRNSQVFLRKFDKTYQTSFFEENLNKNKKKKITQASRKYFSDAIFKKGLHYYVRSIHRLLFVMLSRNLMENPFEQHLQIRLKNRFRIFKNVYFVRTIDYEQYKSDYQTICNDEVGYLNQAMQLLKQAKNIFQKIQTLQEYDCPYKLKQDAQILTKICVKCSLAVMSLKMGQNNKKYKIQNNNKKYPQISLG